MKISNNKNTIIWEKLQNKAVKKRQLDLSILNKLNFKEKYSIELGLKETFDWFKKQKEKIKNFKIS